MCRCCCRALSRMLVPRCAGGVSGRPHPWSYSDDMALWRQVVQVCKESRGFGEQCRVRASSSVERARV
jgi:hypothetical protein